MTIHYQYANLLQARGFGLNVFSPADLEQIHLATLDVLWNIGLQVKSQHARDILADKRASALVVTDYPDSALLAVAESNYQEEKAFDRFKVWGRR